MTAALEGLLAKSRELLRKFDPEADDGHWVTIDGAHVLIGSGGTILKGPAHLVGTTVAKPGSSNAPSALTPKGKEEYAKLKARLLQAGADYRAAAEKGIAELVSLEKQTRAAIARAEKETRRISDSLENVWPGDDLIDWFDHDDEYQLSAAGEREYEQLEELIASIPELPSGPDPEDGDLHGAIDALRDAKKGAGPFLKAAGKL